MLLLFQPLPMYNLHLSSSTSPWFWQMTVQFMLSQPIFLLHEHLKHASSHAISPQSLAWIITLSTVIDTYAMSIALIRSSCLVRLLQYWGRSSMCIRNKIGHSGAPWLRPSWSYATDPCTSPLVTTRSAYRQAVSIAVIPSSNLSRHFSIRSFRFTRS